MRDSSLSSRARMRAGSSARASSSAVKLENITQTAPMPASATPTLNSRPTVLPARSIVSA